MSIEHLSEARIQECLDYKCRGLEPTEQKHLEECEKCQGILSDYEVLYTELARDRRPLLSADFTSRTMAIIRRQVVPAAWAGRTSLIFAVFGIVSCVVAMIFLFDVKALLNTATSFSLESTISQSSFVDTLGKMTTDLGPILPVLIFAGLLLIGVAVADKLLVRQKTTRAYFLSI